MPTNTEVFPKLLKHLFGVVLLTLTCSSLQAAEQVAQTEDLLNMGLEDLLQMRISVSALSGRSQYLSTRLLAQTPYLLDRILFEAAADPVKTASDAASGIGLAPAIGSFAQPAISPDEIEASSAPDDYLRQIARTEQQFSPFDSILFEQYLGLGLSYQLQGDHENAITAFEKAEYISRINNGLYAPDQFPIIERMIDSYLATGNVAAANSRQQYLLYVNTQHYGENSLEVVPVLNALGDRNMHTFLNALHAGNYVGFISGGRGSSRNLTPRALAYMNVYRAQDQYYRAIMSLVDNKKFDTNQMTSLELKLIEAIFLGAHRQGILDNPVFYMKGRRERTGSRIMRDELNSNSMSFINGRNAWSRMRIYEQVNTESTPLDKVRPMLGLADWHRLFNRRKRANDLYLEARDYLVEQQIAPDIIEAIFNPAVPVQLPWFAPRPNSRRFLGIAEEEQPIWDGWLDVSFTLSKYGTASNIKILGHSDNTTREIERRLRRVIQHSPFRPRILDKEETTSSEVQVRYYFVQK